MPDNFWEDKRKRYIVCKNKDSIIKELLLGLDLKVPSEFHAILMPNLYGVELFYLLEQDVPNRNLFAIERNQHVHCKYRDSQYKHLSDITTTKMPSNVSDAIDLCYYHRKKWDLIYLDFLSRLTADQVEAIHKISKLEMLSDNGTLILTFGKNRASECAIELEKCMEESKCDLVVELMKTPHKVFHYTSTGGNNKKLEYKTYAFNKNFKQNRDDFKLWKSKGKL